MEGLKAGARCLTDLRTNSAPNLCHPVDFFWCFSSFSGKYQLKGWRIALKFLNNQISEASSCIQQHSFVTSCPQKFSCWCETSSRRGLPQIPAPDQGKVASGPRQSPSPLMLESNWDQLLPPAVKIVNSSLAVVQILSTPEYYPNACGSLVRGATKHNQHKNTVSDLGSLSC